MEDRIKILFAKLTILTALLVLGLATYYFNLEYSLSKSFQLGTLVALGVLAGAAILFFALPLLLIPIASKFASGKEEIISDEEESYALPREERIIRHNTKEEYIEHGINERMKVRETQNILKEMAEEQGIHAEVMLVLPHDLSYLLAKESINNLSFGKIKEENEEAGTIMGTAGFGRSPQELRLTVQTVTEHSTKINIISKSPSKEQSDKKNSPYIQKISGFLREKEKFYTE